MVRIQACKAAALQIDGCFTDPPPTRSSGNEVLMGIRTPIRRFRCEQTNTERALRRCQRRSGDAGLAANKHANLSAIRQVRRVVARHPSDRFGFCFPAGFDSKDAGLRGDSCSLGEVREQRNENKNQFTPGTQMERRWQKPFGADVLVCDISGAQIPSHKN